MKHTLKVTIILVTLFFVAQVMGLLVTNAYIDHKATAESGEPVFISLPYEIERPPVEEAGSYVFILSSILIGTVLVLVLVRFRKVFLWKIWFFAAVVISLSIAFSAFINPTIAFLISLGLAWLKIFRPSSIIHNVTEIFIYGGLAAIFVPIMSVTAAAILLIIISAYDFIAVFKIKHMITMAKFQTESKVFAGLMLPYKKGKYNAKASKRPGKSKMRTAILGGGDIGFPLLFSGVVMKNLMLTDIVLVGFLKTLVITAAVSAALLFLFIKGKQDKFYPAMPYLTAGCFLGYAIIFALL